MGPSDSLFSVALLFSKYCLPVFGGSTLSGQSDCFLLTGAMHATANQWRVVRIAEDPSNSDIAAVNASYVVCHNLNQYANGLTWQ